MFFARRRRVDRRKQSQTPKGRRRGTGGGPQTRGRGSRRTPARPGGLPPGFNEGGQVPTYNQLIQSKFNSTPVAQGYQGGGSIKVPPSMPGGLIMGGPPKGRPTLGPQGRRRRGSGRGGRDV